MSPPPSVHGKVRCAIIAQFSDSKICAICHLNQKNRKKFRYFSLDGFYNFSDGLKTGLHDSVARSVATEEKRALNSIYYRSRLNDVYC